MSTEKLFYTKEDALEYIRYVMNNYTNEEQRKELLNYQGFQLIPTYDPNIGNELHIAYYNKIITAV